MGDVTDLTNFIGAVIDDRSFANNKAAIDRAKSDPTCTVIAGGTYDGSRLLRPPDRHRVHRPREPGFTTEYFGPILAIHVYEDENYHAMLDRWSRSPHLRADRGHRGRPRGRRVHDGQAPLRRGQLLINASPPAPSSASSPSAAAGASGTNDKAGAPQNLQRWTLTGPSRRRWSRAPTTPTPPEGDALPGLPQQGAPPGVFPRTPSEHRPPHRPPCRPGGGFHVRGPLGVRSCGARTAPGSRGLVV
ncbi:hypothetical protein SBADM41S_04930 [Streptomyces badius]